MEQLCFYATEPSPTMVRGPRMALAPISLAETTSILGKIPRSGQRTRPRNLELFMAQLDVL